MVDALIGADADRKDTRMKVLQACFELEQAKARYCRLMDTKNWAELATLLTEDLVFDLTDWNSEAAPIVVGTRRLKRSGHRSERRRPSTRFIPPSLNSMVTRHA